MEQTTTLAPGRSGGSPLFVARSLHTIQFYIFMYLCLCFFVYVFVFVFVFLFVFVFGAQSRSGRSPLFVSAYNTSAAAALKMKSDSRDRCIQYEIETPSPAFDLNACSGVESLHTDKSFG